MASIRCKNGVEHVHQSVEESRRCWKGSPLLPAPPVVALPPVPPAPKFQDWRDKRRTDEQLDKVRKENGDVLFAMKLTRGECSDYINCLVRGMPYKSPFGWTPTDQTQPQPERRTAVTDDPRLMILKTMVPLIPEGYYATAPDGENRHNDFVRIVTQHGKRSHWKGALTIQTQHSDRWSDPRIVFWPSGKVSLYDGGQSCIGMVQEIVSDYKTAALRYSILNTRCMRCGAKLTDDRSKHYLVGPECESKHGYVWPIEFADEWNEATFEQLRHTGKSYNQHHKSLNRKAA